VDEELTDGLDLEDDNAHAMGGTCPSCGGTVDRGQSFCTNCGKQRGKPSLARVSVPHAGPRQAARPSGLERPPRRLATTRPREESFAVLDT
jgi:hypothetical protein